MMAILFLGAAFVALVGHGYFWVAIVNRLHGLAGRRKLIDLATLACTVCFLAFPVYVLAHGKAVFAYWNSFSVSESLLAVRYFQACLLMSLGEFLVKSLWPSERDQSSTLLEASRESVDVDNSSSLDYYRGSYARFLGAIPGNQSTQLSIDCKRVMVPQLNHALEGIRIVHLSDFHMTGRLDVEWYKIVVDQVTQLEPDVVIITGDIVENPECFPWLEETIGQLSAEFGVYFILGNHDKYVDIARTKMILASAGHVCVSGQCLETAWNGVPVFLAGNERPWFENVGAWPEVGNHEARTAPLRVALQHTPDQWEWSRNNDVDLVFAGHTHGGQICLPILGAVACPSLYGTRYAAGVFRRGNCVMHVTRGLSGRTPLRWLCPPEIALLELVGPA